MDELGVWFKCHCPHEPAERMSQWKDVIGASKELVPEKFYNGSIELVQYNIKDNLNCTACQNGTHLPTPDNGCKYISPRIRK